jgi:hypothetical protein
MKTIPDDVLELIIGGLHYNIHHNKHLTIAVNTIFENNAFKLADLYKYSRHNTRKSVNDKEYSKELGLEILNKMKTDVTAFKLILNNLPHIYDISLEEFEIIINETFNNLPEQKTKLIKFVSEFGAKSKIAKSNLSKEIKNELTSYLVVDKLTN